MKVVLINPNYRTIYEYAGSKKITPVFPPLGLGYIGAFLKQAEVNVEILDANALDWRLDQIKNYINQQTDLHYIGITSVTNTIEEAYQIALACPDNIKVIIGGYHASALPIQTMQEFPRFDILVKGEGEHIMLDIVSGKSLNKIEGILYREKDRIIENSEIGRIENIGDLPHWSREMLPIERYKTVGAKNKKVDYILSSRGCPYSCIFCTDHLVHGKKFRFREPKDVVDEIKNSVNQFGFKEFDFVDDNFTMIRQRAVDICDLLIKEKLNKKIIWRCSNGLRIDRLDLKLLKKIKKAGCYMVSLGIESGNEQILKNIKKNLTLDQVRRVAKWCQQVKIQTRGLFMIGNLGENERTIMNTINFAKELPLTNAVFHITIPFPSTEYWQIIKKNGKLFPKSWGEYTAYGKAIFSLDNCTPEMLIRMQKLAYKSYYFRLSYILKQIFGIRSRQDIKRLFSIGFPILKFIKK